MKIRFKLILLLLLISVFIASTISLLFYQNQKRVLHSDIKNRLRSISKTKEIRVHSMINTREELIVLAASNPYLVKDLHNYTRDANRIDQFEITQLLKNYKDSIESFKEGYVLSKDGQIIASTDSIVVGENWSSHESFKAAISGSHYMDNLHFDKDKQLSLYLSAPLYFENRIIGVIMMLRTAEGILSLSSDYTGMGKSGETYFGKQFGDSIVIITPARFDKNAALKRSLPANDTSTSLGKIINTKKDTLLETKDYRGKKVLSALNYFPETGWGMVTEFDYEESLIPIIRLRQRLLLFNGVVTIVALCLAYLLGSSLVKPIERLTSTANKFSEGNFSEPSRIKSKNEIGILSHSLNVMARRLEEKITKSDTMFSTVFESVEQGIVLFKVIRDSSNQIIDFEYVLVNRWTEKLLGRKRKDLVGKRWTEEYPNVKDIGLFKLQAKVVETGKSVDTDFYYGFQGLDVWYKNRIIKVSDDEVLATFDDITEQKESHIQLENLQSIYHQSQALGNIGSYEWNFLNKKLTLTPEMSDILCSGVIKNKVLKSMDKHPFEEVIHPDYKERANKAIKHAIFDHQPYSIEYKISCPGNIDKYIWSQGKVFYDNKDEPIKLIGTVLDITEWKKDQREILERKMLLSLAEEMANLGSFEFDLENKKNTWSDQLYRMYGYEPNEFELTDVNLPKVVHPDDREYVKKIFTDKIFQEDEFDFQFNFVRKDDSVGVNYGKIKVFKKKNNRITKVTGFVQDITKRVKMLEELKTLNTKLESRVNERTKELSVSIHNLKKLNDSLDKYAYVISHDLKSPLAAIEGLIPFIKEETEQKPLDEEGLKMLDMVSKKVEDMKNIIEDVLKTAKEQRQDKESIQLAELCQDVLTTLNPPSQFHIHIPDTLPMVNYNKTSLNQILQNLIGNAIKYTDKSKPEIKIASIEKENEYQISVYDNGAGIPKDKLPKIFEVFEIAHKRKNVDSHGIGLSIVKQLTESNGGKVWVESELGKETTFYFTIPK